jgi:hypothetical protein
MRTFIVWASLAFNVGSLLAQPSPAPVKARVGDWVSMKVVGKPGASIILKQTLLAQNDTTATIKIERITGDKVQRTDEVKIPLEHLRDPAKLALKLEKSKLEKTTSGKETLEIKGQKLNCDWSEFKVSYIADGKRVELTSKIWISPEIPLNGMVKMEDQKGGIKTNTMELIDFGRGK